MALSFEIITPPTEEQAPLSIEECRQIVGLRGPQDDARLRRHRDTARVMVEAWCDRSIAATTYRATFNRFSSSALELPRGPVTGVTAVDYRQVSDGAWTAVDPAGYEWLAGDAMHRAKLYAAQNTSWPDIRGHYADVRVTYTGGYGTREECRLHVPELLDLMAQVIDFLFSNPATSDRDLTDQFQQTVLLMAGVSARPI